MKPFASSACLYSWPRMYSSGKFLVPMTIVGPADWAGRAKAAANKPRTIATPSEIANAALAALRVCLRITATPFETVGSPTTLVPRRPLGVTAICNAEEADEDRRGESHHAERGAEHAREPVARLVDDDVAEPAAAGDRGDRRGRDDRDGGDPDAGEEQRNRERQLDAPQDLAARSCPCRAPPRRRRGRRRRRRRRRSSGSGRSRARRARPCC